MLSDKELKEHGFRKFSKMFLKQQETAGDNPGYTHYTKISDNGSTIGVVADLKDKF